MLNVSVYLKVIEIFGVLIFGKQIIYNCEISRSERC